MLRNKIKEAVERLLAKHHANNLGQRIIYWKSPDFHEAKEKVCAGTSSSVKRRISREVLNVVESVSTKDKGNISNMGVYFEGISYLFPNNDNKNIHNRHITNNTCIGRKIVLDPREPQDDLSRPFRMLHYPPLAIYVQPEGPPIGDVCGGIADCPPNCIPIPRKTVNFTVSWKGLLPYFEDGEEKGSALSVRRTGIPLAMSYAVTGKWFASLVRICHTASTEKITVFFMCADYYAQGMSFKGDPWLLHLALPDNRRSFSRANIIVPLTRPSKWSQLKLLSPLWTDAKGKAAYVTQFMSALKVHEGYVAEMKLANSLAKSEEMRQRYLDLMKKPMPLS